MSFFNSIKNIFRLILGRRLWISTDKNYILEKHGSDYGGWNIVPDRLNKDSLVYSFGLGDDISFDLSLIKTFELTVHGFDPTPKSVKWINNHKLSKNFVFHDLGIYHYDGFVNFSEPTKKANISFRVSEENNQLNSRKLPVKKMATIMSSLGHKHVHILKMDIEGSEYNVVEDLIETNIRPDQILIEFHHKFINKNLKNTQDSINSIRKMGYDIFYVSDDQTDYGFIKIKQ